MELTKMGFRPADAILAAALLILSFFIYLFLPGNKEPGTVANIRVGGEIYATVDLSVNKTFHVTGPGGYQNVIVVKDGAICFLESDCPDRLCVRFGKLTKAGEFAACVPNRVAIEIIAAGGAQNGVDVIA